MDRSLLEIRQEEAFYHSNHYQQFTIESSNSWLGYPVTNLVNLGVSLSNSTQSSRFLDLGCGVGRNAIPIARGTANKLIIDCVDLLPDAIHSFSKTVKKTDIEPSFNFFIRDIANFELQAATYDYIFSVSTLEHLASKKQFIRVLQAIKEATKTMGCVYLIINSEVSEFLMEKQQLIPPFLEVNLSSTEINELLVDIFSGWTIIDSEIKALSYTIERRIGLTEMKTSAITFVAQNDG